MMNAIDDSEVLNTEAVIHKLKDLVELEFNAIATYEAALERIENLEYRAKLTEFLGEHERHLMALCDAIIQEGGIPPEGGDYKQFLTKTPVQIASIGNDKTVLQAMQFNEHLTNRLYQNANDEIFPGYIQLMLKQALGDVRHHRVWIETIIDELNEDDD